MIETHSFHHASRLDVAVGADVTIANADIKTRANVVRVIAG